MSIRACEVHGTLINVYTRHFLGELSIAET